MASDYSGSFRSVLNERSPGHESQIRINIYFSYQRIIISVKSRFFIVIFCYLHIFFPVTHFFIRASDPQLHNKGYIILHEVIPADVFTQYLHSLALCHQLKVCFYLFREPQRRNWSKRTENGQK